MKWTILGAAFLFCAASPAAAQHMIDVPIWSNGILGQQALRNTYDNTNRAMGVEPDSQRRQTATACSADSLPAADRRRMEAEYARRVRSDGQPSAYAWVQEQGRRYREKLISEGVCDASDFER